MNSGAKVSIFLPLHPISLFGKGGMKCRKIRKDAKLCYQMTSI